MTTRPYHRWLLRFALIVLGIFLVHMLLSAYLDSAYRLGTDNPPPFMPWLLKLDVVLTEYTFFMLLVWLAAVCLAAALLVRWRQDENLPGRQMYVSFLALGIISLVIPLEFLSVMGSTSDWSYRATAVIDDLEFNNRHYYLQEEYSSDWSSGLYLWECSRFSVDCRKVPMSIKAPGWGSYYGVKLVPCNDGRSVCIRRQREDEPTLLMGEYTPVNR